ncbi:unnamed protein product [Anisakis simplex]|uniref:sn-1-specific diacylglycerol lipase ABHD11 n=1 Tax=Anisakis simplex TaxID=6269 RepID=A0A0M3JVQ1_ANISI|nr:unnamed protein product [Anisakis simplex]
MFSGDSPWTDSMTYEEMAADVRYFLDEVVPSETDGRYTRAHLLGHSMGGKAAMLVALAKGAEQRLESLIVEDIAPIPYDTESHHQFPKFMEAMKKVNMKGSRGEISLELADVVTDVPTRQFLLTNLDRSEEGYRWKCAFSRYVTPESHPLILQKFPKAEFSVIEDAGHWVHADKPYPFMEKVVSFIESV